MEDDEIEERWENGNDKTCFSSMSKSSHIKRRRRKKLLDDPNIFSLSTVIWSLPVWSHNDPDHHSNGHILCVTLFMGQYLTGNHSMSASSGHHWKEKLKLLSNRLKYWLMIIAINLWKLNPKMRLFWNLLSRSKVSKIATGDIDSTRHQPVFCLLFTPVNQSRLEGDQPW